MTKKAAKLEVNQVIKVGRKAIQITALSFNSGSFGEYIQISGIDISKDFYIKPFTVSFDDKVEVVG